MQRSLREAYVDYSADWMAPDAQFVVAEVRVLPGATFYDLLDEGSIRALYERGWVLEL